MLWNRGPPARGKGAGRRWKRPGQVCVIFLFFLLHRFLIRCCSPMPVPVARAATSSSRVHARNG